MGRLRRATLLHWEKSKRCRAEISSDFTYRLVKNEKEPCLRSKQFIMSIMLDLPETKGNRIRGDYNDVDIGIAG